MNDQLEQGFGECVLKNGEASKIVADALDFHDPDKVEPVDFVVMPNHVHVLMTPETGNDLSDILKSIKGFSARQINRLLNRDGESLWQKESYDHIVRDWHQLIAFQRYIWNNPSKANLPENSFRMKKVEYQKYEH